MPGLARRLAWLGLLLLLTLASLGYAVISGSFDVDAATVWQALFGHEDGGAASVVRELRLPRALAGFVTGALLALAGALMQVLLRNPLADPYGAIVDILIQRFMLRKRMYLFVLYVVGGKYIREFI